MQMTTTFNSICENQSKFDQKDQHFSPEQAKNYFKKIQKAKENKTFPEKNFEFFIS